MGQLPSHSVYHCHQESTIHVKIQLILILVTSSQHRRSPRVRHMFTHLLHVANIVQVAFGCCAEQRGVSYQWRWLRAPASSKPVSLTAPARTCHLAVGGSFLHKPRKLQHGGCYLWDSLSSVGLLLASCWWLLFALDCYGKLCVEVTHQVHISSQLHFIYIWLILQDILWMI